ncbi:kinase-like domain-containing protein [Irpex lacteus]|nr:kinase-like domain-containing protein [Irpex lacteus]
MGFKTFITGLKGLRLGKTTAPQPKKEDAFSKAITQTPKELETEFIAAIAQAFNEAAPQEVKPNLYSFVNSATSKTLSEVVEADTKASAAAKEDTKAHVAPSARILSRDDFEIIRSIGEGSQGKTFLALDTKTETFVAIKIIEKCTLGVESCIRLFEEQHRARSLVDCPWSLGLLGSFEDSMNYYLVSEFAPGGSLEKLLIDDSHSLFAKKSIIADILVALQTLHKHDLIYNDLTPSHILFDTHGRVLLAPSSLSHSTAAVPEGRVWETIPTFATPKHSMLVRNVLSQTATPATSGYTAPEVLDGELPTCDADVFGLGVLAHVLVFGVMPFGIDSSCQIVEECNERTLNAPLDFGECNVSNREAMDLIERMLEKDPRKRATFEEVRAHSFFRCINWHDIDARITSEAHKEAVFRYSAPGWVNATQIPSSGENYVAGKAPCAWFEFVSPSLQASATPFVPSSANTEVEVDLTSFNPLVLPSSHPLSIFTTPSPTPIIAASPSPSSVMTPELASTPSLTSSSDSDTTSSSSPSTPLTEFELDILDLDIVSFCGAKPFDVPGSPAEFFCEDELRFSTFVNSMLPASASSCIFGDKMEAEEDEDAIVLPQVKTVAWWTV